MRRASHLGRPKGKPNPALSLAPVAAVLADHLGAPVQMAPDCIGPEVDALVDALRPGQVVMLENLRFHPEEEKNDEAFARALARLADVYVNDAFGTAHRAHASTVGMVRFVRERAAGFLLRRECEYLGKVLAAPERPLVAILGGAKVSDKIKVIRSLLERVDALLIGGAMAYTFLRAQGLPTGTSLVEEEQTGLASELLRGAAARNVDLVLPVDHVVADEPRTGVSAATVREIPADKMGLDIGPETVSRFRAVIATARTVFWNGPLGMFEVPPFEAGTMAIATAIADSRATSIVGGGDSVAAVMRSGRATDITHISTGGGASLEFLEGTPLPGLVALEESP
jgi:phosphoglycerate kinase